MEPREPESPIEVGNMDDASDREVEARLAETASEAHDVETTVSSANAEQEMRRLSRRSFLWAAVAMATGYCGWHWLTSRRDEDGTLWPFRRVLETNERLARDYYRNSRLSPTFTAAQVEPDPRVNGDIGIEAPLEVDNWRLAVSGMADNRVVNLTLRDIKKLPVVTTITELKCIEGWSMIVRWTGARMSDFMAMYPPAASDGKPADILRNPENLPNYVGLSTPDGGYYVGLDIESALHPQTLLCYAMNDKPLTPEHGAPLRLVIPGKYGIKNIKRIGKIQYTDRRPADYWAERGYDWYAGL